MSCSMPAANTSSRLPASIAAKIAAAASAGGMPLSMAASLTPRLEPSAVSAFLDTLVLIDPGAMT